MLKKVLCAVSVAGLLLGSFNQAVADDHKKSRWVNISKDTNHFNKNCDYKVWVLEDKKWRETWYLEAFDAENAFYTINRQSSIWHDRDDFYALNYKDKTKFLIGEHHVDVIPFSLCLKHD